MLCLKKRKRFWGSSSSSYGPQSKSQSSGLNLNLNLLSSTNPPANKSGQSNESSLSSSSNYTPTDKNSRKGSRASSGGMAPPPASQMASTPVIREVTEDTPPDLLEGTMDLLIVLPSTKTVRMTVDRRTPMMDLLIQVGTVNKVNPGDHIVQIRNERGIELPYKPSTPIGALDTTTIEIVPKSKVSDYIIVKKPAKLANQPFEQTFRLQVHLPRNQLYVMRVSPRTLLEDILKEVCQEKNLDLMKYEIRHPARLEEKLPLNNTLADFDLQEVTVVSKNTRINSSVSTADIMQMTEEARTKGYLDSSFKHSRSSVGDSSVSSGSTGSARGISPTRSDDSRSVSPLPQFHSKSNKTIAASTVSNNSSGIISSAQKSTSMSNMFASPTRKTSLPEPPPRTKKRAAPLPPPMVKSNTESALSSRAIENVSQCTKPLAKSSPKKKEAPRLPPNSKVPDLTTSSRPQNNHSRHSSGSSGYHESSVLSEQNESFRIIERQISAPQGLSKQMAARSTSNLTTVSSLSSTSLASSVGGSSKKRRAPVPPSSLPLKPQGKIEEEGSESSSSISHGLVSSKSRESRQSSVKVEVDVHHSSRKVSSDLSDSTPISVDELKEMEMLSSSPSSSLSNPGSSSGSTSSSPLPRTDSPSSKPEPNHSSQYSSAKNSSSDPVNDSSNLNSLHSIEDSGRSSSSPSSGQASAPLPPPRRKTQETLLPNQESIIPTELNSRPKPKPRPDRKSVDILVANNPSIIRPKEVESTDEPESTPPVLATQLRNPLARYGVKVLPDNVVKERADRLAIKASLESALTDSVDNSIVHETTIKSSAPPPPRSNSEKSLGHDKAAKSTTISQKKDSFSSFSSDNSSSPPKSKPPPPPPTLSKSEYTGKGSVRSIQNLNAKLNSKPSITKSTQEKSIEYDSDDLEENLELFELTPASVSKTESPEKAHTFIKNSFDKHKSLNSSNSSHASERPVPKPKAKPVESKETESSHKARVFSSLSGVTLDSSEDLNEEEGLSRSNSDRLKNKKPSLTVSKTDDSSSKQLNRWQNLISLNEIDDLASTNTTKTISTNKPSILKATLPLSSSNKDGKSCRSSSEDDALDDHEDTGNMSSESETSYTDSGIPASAEPITPSPMDFDKRISEDDGHLEDHNLDSKDVNQSDFRGSSFESNDEEQWKQILEAKALKTQEDVENKFASMIPENFGKDHFKESKRSELSQDSGADDEEHISTSEGESLEDELKSLNSSTPIKRLSKSESFSHNSEFDIVQMKRKKFSGAGMKADAKRGNSNIDLRRSSHHSSSEEDIRVPYSEERKVEKTNKDSHKESGNKIKDHRATSMHNLTSDSGMKNRKKENNHLTNKAIQKTTSLMEIPKVDSVNISNDPANMNIARSQLEAQFEQWKEDFMKKHLLDSSNHEDSTDSSIHAKAKVDIRRPDMDAELMQTSSPTEAAPVIVEETFKENRDISESHKSTPDTYGTTQKVEIRMNQDSSESDIEESSSPSVAQTTFVQVVKAYPVKDIKDKPQSEAIDSHTSPEVERRVKPQQKPTPPMYRYSGPPTINMGSWTERPKTAVVVKTDQDYIMGFGQADPKSSSENGRPSSGLKVQKTSSFKTNDSVDRPINFVSQNSTTNFIQSAVSNSPAINKSNNVTSPNKGLSITLNARPMNKEPSENKGSVRSVLSTWKARMEENTPENKLNQGPPPEIDIYGSGTDEKSSVDMKIQRKSSLLNESKEAEKTESSKFNSVIITNGNNFDDRTSSSNSVMNVSSKLNSQGSQAAVNDIVKNNTFNQSEVRRQESITKQTTPTSPSMKAEVAEKESPETKPIKSLKPVIFRMSAMESKPVIRTMNFVENPTQQESVDRSLVKQSIPNSPQEEIEPSIQEKKRFFQGIKPQNNGKETPVPAVNMKGSIATIQKVFEQRQQQTQSSTKSSPVIERSMTLPTPSRELEKSESMSKNPQVGSTMPRNFQGMSSAEMVQRVLGKPSGFNYNEAFRRSPSPVSSTTSTLSRTSSSGRGTPSSTDIPDSAIKVSSGYKKSAPTPPSNIHNVGNKAIIIVNGNDNNKNNAETNINRSNSVSNNIFKQNLQINSTNQPTKESNSTKIIVNGSGGVGRLSQQFSGEKAQIVEQAPKNITIEPFRKTSVTQIDIKQEIKPVSKPKSLNISGVPPPPPPPPGIENLISKPMIKSKSVTSLNTSTGSKVSTPTSLTSPDPRIDIFNLIKNSNGNFGLKKTGSTFLVKK